MPNPNNIVPSRPRDGWVTLGLVISASSAALTSFDGLRQLALAVEWSAFTAPLLPLTVDAFAATATRVWLAKSTGSDRARRFARACAIGAILLSLAGNAAFHLIQANLLDVTWIIVFGVGAIPPVILGLVAHLAVLRAQQDQRLAEDGVSTVLSTVLSPAVEPPKPEVQQQKPAGQLRTKASVQRKSSTATASTEALLAAARAADAAYREQYGRAITRDQLRQTLRIGAGPATQLLRQLKAQPEDDGLAVYSTTERP